VKLTILFSGKNFNMKTQTRFAEARFPEKVFYYVTTQVYIFLSPSLAKRG